MVTLASLSLQVQYCTLLPHASEVAERIGSGKGNSEVSQDGKNKQIRGERSGGGCLSTLK